MVKCSIILDTRRKKGNGKYPLKLRVTEYNNVREISLKVEYTESQYKNIFVNTPTGKGIEHRNYAEKIIEKARNILAKMDKFDYECFKEKLLNNSIEASKYSLSNMFQSIIEKMNQEERYRTATSYKTTLNSFVKFKPGLILTDITPQFLHDYEKWFISKHDNKITGTIGSYMRTMKAVINKYKEIDEFPEKYKYPFGRGKYIIPNKKTIKVTLTKSEIESIISLNVFENKFQEYCRDLWLFEFYCNGINFKDLIKLRWDNQKNDCFVITREKTKNTNRNNPRPIRIPITEKVKKLLEKIGKKENPYVLGLIKSGMTELQILNKKEKMGKLLNKNLKEIAKRLDLKVPLQLKTSRYAYATMLNNNGTPITHISESLGHADIKTTMSYLAGIETGQLHKINSALP